MRFIHRTGQETTLRVISFRHVSGPLYSARIGMQTLNRLGYAIAFHRPKHKHHRPKIRVTYHIMRLTPMLRQLSYELGSSNMKTGILGMLTRGCSLLALFRQLDTTGYNLPIHKYRFSLVSIHYLDSKKNILDCIIEKEPYQHHALLSREYPLDDHSKKKEW